MQKRFLFPAFAAILISTFIWSCTKLDTTSIGADLLPAVDNVNTFDTLLTINTSQVIPNDSTVVGKFDDQALGAINNDPLFGTTRANIFMQLKPPFFPYYFGGLSDTITGPGTKFDSVILVLKYNGFWGDSSKPIHLEVREVTDYKFRDSVYSSNPVTYQPTFSGTILGSKDIDVLSLGKVVYISRGRDSVSNQIRIKLSQAWGQQLFFRDSIANNSVNNAFYTDSIFRERYNGIAVLANGIGNGLMYVNVADTATKLEFHYTKRGTNGLDSVYTSFRLNTSTFGSTTNAPSNEVNNIVRNRSGFPVSNPTINELYLQTSPGSYINLDIPGLSTLSNRIVHRAEIIVEQIPNDPLSDNYFSVPNFLYLDLKDTGSTNNWKPLYYDLNPNTFYDPDNKSSFPYYPSGGVDHFYFGGFKKDKTDVFGNPIKYYNLNITRYVQRTITNRSTNYQLRLSAPYNIYYPQYSSLPTAYSNNVAYGRVKIGSGANANYKLRLRIVYSKL